MPSISSLTSSPGAATESRCPCGLELFHPADCAWDEPCAFFARDQHGEVVGYCALGPRTVFGPARWFPRDPPAVQHRAGHKLPPAPAAAPGMVNTLVYDEHRGMSVWGPQVSRASLGRTNVESSSRLRGQGERSPMSSPSSGASSPSPSTSVTRSSNWLAKVGTAFRRRTQLVGLGISL